MSIDKKLLWTSAGVAIGSYLYTRFVASSVNNMLYGSTTTGA